MLHPPFESPTAGTLFSKNCAFEKIMSYLRLRIFPASNTDFVPYHVYYLVVFRAMSTKYNCVIIMLKFYLGYFLIKA